MSVERKIQLMRYERTAVLTKPANVRVIYRAELQITECFNCQRIKMQ